MFESDTANETSVFESLKLYRFDNGPAHAKTYNKTCDQRSLRSACASAQSDQSLR